ncbi:hypothetical protein AB834_04575 [PVC group bacterium (ex Bugula neritina AB1)]|nr:hypothetical protein AB834_04575 [PVC group bacterium (ex Bugula neritina AB1)]
MLGFFLVGALGLCLGSLLNVYIYRTVLNEKTGSKESVLFPKRSYCPKCKKTIKAFDNIPVLSYLWLKGKCRFCKDKISLKYISIEILTSSFFLFLYQHFYIGGRGFSDFFIALFLTYLLIAIFFIDIEVMIIPNLLSLGGLCVALVLSPCFPSWHNTLGEVTFLGEALEGFKSAIYGMIMGGGVIYIIGTLGSLAFKKEAMGGGDLKMMAMVGAFLGWKSIGFILFFSSFLGTIFSLLLIRLKSKKISDEIPFGPYLALGSFLMLCFRYDIYDLFSKWMSGELMFS